MERFFSRYQALLAELAAAMAPLLHRHQTHLQCAPGCAECCQSLSLLAIEAALVREAFAALPLAAQESIRANADAGTTQCPFLLEGLCAIYSSRPIICRTHGLAIGYVDEEEETIEVSACPRNFPEDFPLAAEDLLFLDPLNAQLALLNREFCEAFGGEPANRVAMEAILSPQNDPE